MKYSDEEVKEKLKAFTGWSYADNALSKTYGFGDYGKVMEFVNKVAMIAQSKQHHPDMLVKFGTVTVSTSTHDESGITDKDFDLIRTTEQLALEFI